MSYYQPNRAGSPARDLSVQLADRVEAVCRHYLSNGRRSGGYWIVGDTGNAKGRSLFVRLAGPTQGQGARGKWQDYVALRIMLRICDLLLFFSGLPGCTPHNSSVLQEAA